MFYLLLYSYLACELEKPLVGKGANERMHSIFKPRGADLRESTAKDPWGSPGLKGSLPKSLIKALLSSCNHVPVQTSL